MAKDTVKKTTTKKKVVKKKTEDVPVTEEVAPVVESTPTPTPTPTPAPEVETKDGDLDSRFSALQSRMSELISVVKSLQTETRKLQKDSKKQLKEAQRKKKGGADNANKPKRAPSGFAKPAPISTELCQFLNVSTGTELARTAVTKHITKYIKEHGLQNPENKRHILPDTVLKKLLNVGDKDELTYFNLQKYMKHHFPKPEVNTSA